MKWLGTIAFSLLVACDTPSRDFKGIAATRITVMGSTFDVRIKERRAEANEQHRARQPPAEVEGREAPQGEERPRQVAAQHHEHHRRGGQTHRRDHGRQRGADERANRVPVQIDATRRHHGHDRQDRDQNHQQRGSADGLTVAH